MVEREKIGACHVMSSDNRRTSGHFCVHPYLLQLVVVVVSSCSGHRRKFTFKKHYNVPDWQPRILLGMFSFPINYRVCVDFSGSFYFYFYFFHNVYPFWVVSL